MIEELFACLCRAWVYSQYIECQILSVWVRDDPQGLFAKAVWPWGSSTGTKPLVGIGPPIFVMRSVVPSGTWLRHPALHISLTAPQRDKIVTQQCQKLIVIGLRRCRRPLIYRRVYRNSVFGPISPLVHVFGSGTHIFFRLTMFTWKSSEAHPKRLWKNMFATFYPRIDNLHLSNIWRWAFKWLFQ